MDGSIWAGAYPLRFFHFTKIDTVGESVLRHYAGDRIEPFELVRWYRDQLAKNVVPGLPEGWWAFGAYEDGAPISHQDRVLYRTRSDLQAQFPHPFTSGPGSFQASLRGAACVVREAAVDLAGSMWERGFRSA